MPHDLISRLLVESVDGFSLVDGTGRITVWNPSMESITGIPASEAVGSYIWEIHAALNLDDNQDPRLQEHLRAATLQLLEQASIPPESRLTQRDILHRDGSTRHVQTSLFLVAGSPGPLLGSIVRDCSTLRSVENQLRGELDLLDALFRTVRVGLLILDRNGGGIQLNPAFTEITGYSQDDLPDLEAWFNLAYPALAHNRTARDAWQQDLERGGAHREIRVRASDGTIKDLQYSVALLDGGRCIVSVEDVSDLRGSLRALAQSQHWLTRAQRLSRTGHYELDVQTGNWTCSPMLREIFGFDEETALHHKEWEAHVHPHDLARIKQDFETRVLQEKRDVDWTYRFFRIDTGEQIWLHAKGELRRGGKGELKAVFGVVRDITDRRQAEERLRESEHKYRTLFETMSLGVVHHERGGRVLAMNPAARSILGFGPDEVQRVARNQSQRIILREDGQPARPEEIPFKMAMETGRKVLGAVMGVQTPETGTIAWIQVDAVPEFEVGSTVPARAYSVFEDISERKRIQDQLRESAETYLNLFHHSPLGLFHYDDKGCITDCNEQFVEIIGSSREALLGLNMIERLKNDEIIGCVRDSLDKGEAHYRGWYDSVTANKRTHVRILFRGIRDKQGEVTAGLGLVENTTSQIEAEYAVRSSEEKYRLLVEQSADAIFLLYDQRFEYVNRSFLEFLELDRSTVTSPDFDFLECVSPECRQLVGSWLKRAHVGQSAAGNLDFTAISSSGQRLELEATITHVPYLDGLATQGILRNVTERKHLEEQLHQAQKMEAVGRLAGGVAHDFNNLLTVINGYCEIVSGLEMPWEARESIEEIHNAGRRAARLTNQLLAFSRKQVIQPRVIDLNLLIAEHTRMLGRLLGEDVDISIRTGEDVANVLVDPGQMEQVLLNLAVNARDAMPEGGRLTIAVRSHELVAGVETAETALPPGDYILLSVDDSGVGMDEGTLSRIFEPFFTTKEQGKGTGLGLATIYGIIKQSGGDIRVKSQPGVGTGFRILLPRAAAQPDPTGLGSSCPLPSGGETLLLVEDDRAIRDVTRAALERCGFKLLTAANGVEGLEQFRQHGDEIALVISDVVMPVMGGIEFAKELGKLAPEMSVLFVSGYTSSPEGLRPEPGEDWEYIQKPFSTHEIASRVRQILDR